MLHVTLFRVTSLLYSTWATSAVKFQDEGTKGELLQESALLSSHEIAADSVYTALTGGDASRSAPGDEAKAFEGNSKTSAEVPWDQTYYDANDAVGAPAIVTSPEETAEETKGTGPQLRSRRDVIRLQDLMDTLRLISRDRVYPNKVYRYIQNISNHITKANGNHTNIISDRFIVAGYTARLYTGIQDNKGELWFGAYLQLCPGPNDDYLHWPFRIPHTFSFNHPTMGARDKTMRLTPERSPSYKKPTVSDVSSRSAKLEGRDSYKTMRSPSP